MMNLFRHHHPCSISDSASARVLVLGGGCSRCRALESNVRAALQQMGLDEPVGHITDDVQIAAYGVLSTPALVVDGRVLSCGKVLSQSEAEALIRSAWKG